MGNRQYLSPDPSFFASGGDHEATDEDILVALEARYRPAHPADGSRFHAGDTPLQLIEPLVGQSVAQIDQMEVADEDRMLW